MKNSWDHSSSIIKISVQFSCSVGWDSLQPHELQDARPPCPSPTPGVHSNSCPLSRWCHLILHRPLLLLPPIPPSIRVFSNESTFAWGGQRPIGLYYMLSHFSRVQLCATLEMAAHQAPLSLGFSRQEHWSGLPFPSPMHESEKGKWSRSVVSDS